MNAMEPDLTQRVIELARTTYLGFNRHHLTEMLAERQEIHLSQPTVHRLLQAARISAPRKRRPAKAHHRRDRMTQEGCLQRVDESRHDWLEGRHSPTAIGVRQRHGMRVLTIHSLAAPAAFKFMRARPAESRGV